MADTTEVNTQYIWTWIGNDPEYYDEALRIADRGELDELREYITKTLREAPEGSGAYYTNREMSDEDFDTVDWDDIRSCLVS